MVGWLCLVWFGLVWFDLVCLVAFVGRIVGLLVLVGYFFSWFRCFGRLVGCCFIFWLADWLFG